MDTSQICWQHLCTTATIFVPANIDVVNTGLLNAIKQDFGFMQLKVALIRVNALPLGSSVEIEMSCDTSRFENDKLDKLWKNYPYQKFYKTFDDYESAAADRQNLYGEVYYQKDMLNMQ